MRRSLQPPSLKSRAVHWLSQREHSEAELRRKLMRAEHEAVRRAALVDGRAAVRTAVQADDRSRMPGAEPARTGAEPGDTSVAAGDRGGGSAAEVSDLAERVDAVIAWLRAHGFLSDARFVESRVHARAPGHGLRRIRQELEQHGVSLPADTAAALRASELERAEAMCRRRYGDDGPATATEGARCARWLVQRGFAGDTVARVMRTMRRSASAHPGDGHGDQVSDRDEG